MKQVILETLESLGFFWKYAVVGLIGSICWSVYKKSRFWESLRLMFVGSIVAGFLTPIISKQLEFDPAFLPATSFCIGITGMTVLETIYKWAVKKSKLLYQAILLVSKDDIK